MSRPTSINSATFDIIQRGGVESGRIQSTIAGNCIAFSNCTFWSFQHRNLHKEGECSKITCRCASKEASWTWQQQENICIYIYIRLQNDVCYTFPRGLSFRNSGVVFVTPIWNDGVSSIFTPTYSAAISALNTFLLLPTGEWITWNGSHQQPPPPKSG